MRKTMSESAFRYGKLKPVTWSPKWVLRLRGRINSWKGPTVPDAFCRRLCERLKSREAIEASYCESILQADRTKAARTLALASVSVERLANIPMTAAVGEPGDIRAARRNAADRNQTASTIVSTYDVLAASKEHIDSVEVILDERIRSLRKGITECLYEYCMGVRKGRKTKDYEIPVLPIDDDNNAVEAYMSKHACIDRYVFEYLHPDTKKEDE